MVSKTEPKPKQVSIAWDLSFVYMGFKISHSFHKFDDLLTSTLVRNTSDIICLHGLHF